MADAIPPLKGEQLAASDPGGDVWVSASAGTGKTQVLSARVLRLLLSGARPETILCLTFTKAGAAEMAERVNATLARWVRAKSADLAKELMNLGEDHAPERREYARQLFAKVLDAPGGGLRVMTIHSFCQTLLAGFPMEAGLIPGFRPVEGREEAALAQRVLAEMLADAEAAGEGAIVDAVAALSLRLGEEKARQYLLGCARAPQAMAALEDVDALVWRALELEGDPERALCDACGAEDARAALELAATLNREWLTAKGEVTVQGAKHAGIITEWLAMDGAGRAEGLADLQSVWLTGTGTRRAKEPDDAAYATLAERLIAWVGERIDMKKRVALGCAVIPALKAGQRYAAAYQAAKRAAGLVDFDDMIRATVALLDTPGMGDWIRFKLDQATDHILVDEAQDTNAAQWSIVKALAEEFHAGEGARGDAVRTIFTVGDYKQAIFGFQGTDPEEFGLARRFFAERVRAASTEEVPRKLSDLSLNRSFRSSPPVLEVVDAVLGALGEDRLGAGVRAEAHVSARGGAGSVILWPPVTADDEDGDDAEEGWVPGAARMFAARLAKQVKAWTGTLWMHAQGRMLEPGDVMILVRSRGELASLIVARLHEEGVPVAGVDRLRLNAPLAVRDLLAAMRFALQPADDLNLACLLVSPLIGWSQDELFAAAHGRKGGLRARVELPALKEMLDTADFLTPYGFLENILSGAIDGRRKLIARLGEEARDHIDELLNAALAFESTATPSLQGFVDWFDRGEVDVKRDPAGGENAVRVMTVHGSKGLQAPLVILADATADPALKRGSFVDWSVVPGAPPVPIYRPRKDDMAGSVRRDAETQDARERAEHWRLLYVAMTRAEERLVIGGALGERALSDESWHAAIQRGMLALGAPEIEHEGWGASHAHEADAPRKPASKEPIAAREVALPDWLRRRAPAEARPPRPLAPSSLGEDDASSPPPGPHLRAAAERGRLLHALFERLPAVSETDRRQAALRWLKRSAGVMDADTRDEIVSAALVVIEMHPELFVSDALAEAPIAAVVNGDVISGTVDRLVVADDVVRLIDFKTGRRVPASAEEAPVHHLRQMSAYAEALKVIFPGRQVGAALLYTAGPTLIDLPADLLARHKPGLQDMEQSLG